MDFDPDQAGAELATGLRVLLKSQLDGRTLREVLKEPSRREELWSALSDQGLPATLVPEKFDGLELGWSAATLLLEELGKSGAPGPLIDSLVVAPGILSLVGDACAVPLERIAAGELRIGVADPHGRIDAPDELDAVLICSGGSSNADGTGASVAKIAIYPMSEIEWVSVPALDEGVALGRVTSVATPDVAVEVDGALFEQFSAMGMLATAAALVGVSRRMLEITVAYVTQRVAFGKVIGSYQAIQHPLVDVALKIEIAAPIIQAAAWSLDLGRPDAVERAAHAKLAAVQASSLAWRVCLQSHGAIGYTEEYDLQLWLKRSLTLAGQHGSAAEVRGRLRRVLLDRIDLSDSATTGDRRVN